MAETKPIGEQLRFLSAKTGDHELDAYLEACEIGSRPVYDLLEEIFSDTTGHVRPDFIRLRVGGDFQLQIRAGQYDEDGEGWQNTGAFFAKFRGNWTPNTAYHATDYVVIENIVQICTEDHTSALLPNRQKFIALVGAPSLGALSQVTPTEDTLVFFTGDNSSALCTLTPYARQLLDDRNPAEMRGTLQLGDFAIENHNGCKAIKMVEPLTLNDDPTVPLHAATKQYVDRLIQELDAKKEDGLGYTPLDIAGGTMTGPLYTSRDPQDATEVATKAYVDGRIDEADYLDLATGGTVNGPVTIKAGENSFTVSPNGITYNGKNLTWDGNLTKEQVIRALGYTPLPDTNPTIHGNAYCEGQLRAREDIIAFT